MRVPGRCQEAPGRAAVGKDLPAAISVLQHSAATRNCAGCAENDGGAGTLGEAAGEGGRGLSLRVFLSFLCQILLPPLVKALKRAVVPQPHGTYGHAEDRDDT